MLRQLKNSRYVDVYGAEICGASLFPGCSPCESIVIACCLFSSISLGLILMRMDRDQRCPNGSTTIPYRSPQNWLSRGIATLAPASTACCHSLSTFFV